ncbi:MAG: S-layer homology domain-containing protein [Oscillospiraceae bacterium]|nr:S-layer homology domain-containing protein [Oscillospiraceae bacterium]
MTKHKKSCSISLVFALLAPLFFAMAAFAASPSVPYIFVDFAPAINEGSTIEGHIWFDGEPGDCGAYAVTMALQVTRDGQTWGPKPTYANPSVEVNAGGYFSCLFVTGGYDIEAQRLFVWLIPRDFIPDGDFAKTEAAAFDKAVIERYDDGRVEIKHTKEEPPPKPEKIFPVQKKPSETDKLSICYSPYTNGLSPETNSFVPMEQMRWQLNLIYPYADTIRLFGVSGELEKIFKPAKEEYKMRVIAGCWIDSRYSEQQIYAELDKLIELANAGYVDIAAVGSETIHRGDFSADELIIYMQYVRERLNDENIPVGTSDTSAAFLKNPKLARASDVILCTIYPFFSNVTADSALKNLEETYERVKAVSGGRQVIISESGWPTEGSPEGLAIPGIGGAKKFFEETYKWSREKDVEVIFFSEIDEAWKVEGQNGDIGGHWGHFTSAGMLKDAYLPVYKSISPVPVLDAAAVEWAEEAILELVGQGIADPNGPSLYAPLVPITRGDFIHYLVKALGLEAKTGQAGATFLDVDENIYYYFTMGSGQKAGLVKGTGDNFCLPESDITRQDMFTLIHRALEYAGMNFHGSETAPGRFGDWGEVADYAKEAISALAESGLVLGDQNGNVNPAQNATRAEAAVLLYRVHNQ